MIYEKSLVEKCCLQLLRHIPGIFVSSFGGDADVLLNTIIHEEMCDEDSLDELLGQLSFIPQYLVQKIEEGYIVSTLYYLRIEFFDCPVEKIKISNEILKYLYQYFPHTRLIIVTPYNSIFYCVDADNIEDGENLDLKNYPLEDMYKVFTNYDSDIRTVLKNSKALLKSIFGTDHDIIERENV